MQEPSTQDFRRIVEVPQSGLRPNAHREILDDGCERNSIGFLHRYWQQSFILFCSLHPKERDLDRCATLRVLRNCILGCGPRQKYAFFTQRHTREPYRQGSRRRQHHERKDKRETGERIYDFVDVEFQAHHRALLD